MLFDMQHWNSISHAVTTAQGNLRKNFNENVRTNVCCTSCSGFPGHGRRRTGSSHLIRFFALARQQLHTGELRRGLCASVRACVRACVCVAVWVCGCAGVRHALHVLAQSSSTRKTAKRSRTSECCLFCSLIPGYIQWVSDELKVRIKSRNQK